MGILLGVAVVTVGIIVAVVVKREREVGEKNCM